MSLFRKHHAALGVYVNTIQATLSVLDILNHCRQRSKTSIRIRQLKYLRKALLPPRNISAPVPWRQLLSLVRSSNFITAVNFPMDVILCCMPPAFDMEQQDCNFGSPFRVRPKSRSRKPTLTTIDLLVMSSWYPKTSGTQYLLLRKDNGLQRPGGCLNRTVIV